MQKNKIIIATLIMLTLLNACSHEPPTPQTQEPRPVKTLVITNETKNIERNYPGYVNAGQQVNLSFLVQGPLIKLPVKEGEKVKQGQFLAQIDPKDYEIAAAQAKAKYQIAKITFDRYQQLLPAHAISKQEYDEKKYDYEFLKSQYDQALKAIQDTNLYAPFSGRIARRFVENYQFVKAKQNILSLQNLTSLEIIINVPEQDISRAGSIAVLGVQGGKKIIGHVSFPTLPNTKFPVVLKELSAVADPQTQTYRVVLTMPLPENLILLPGMTANVAITFGSKESKSYYIPADVIMIDAKGDMYVWVVNAKSMAVAKRKVKTGKLLDNKMQILSGLNNGDRIVIAGGPYLQEGMKVKLISTRIGH